MLCCCRGASPPPTQRSDTARPTRACAVDVGKHEGACARKRAQEGREGMRRVREVKEHASGGESWCEGARRGSRFLEVAGGLRRRRRVSDARLVWYGGGCLRVGGLVHTHVARGRRAKVLAPKAQKDKRASLVIGWRSHVLVCLYLYRYHYANVQTVCSQQRALFV